MKNLNVDPGKGKFFQILKILMKHMAQVQRLLTHEVL